MRRIAALVVVTGVYVLVALAALGTQPWQDFADRNRRAGHLGQRHAWRMGQHDLAAGAVVSIFTVTLVTTMARPDPVRDGATAVTGAVRERIRAP